MSSLALLLPESGLVGSLILLPALAVLAGQTRQTARKPKQDSHGTAFRRDWDLYFLTPLLLIVGLLHDRFGIAGSERAVAAALYVAASLIVLRCSPALAQRLASREKAGWPFFALAAAFFLVLAPWATHERSPNGDEPWNLLVVHSLVHDLDDDLSNNYADQSSLAFMDTALEPQPGDPAGRDGGLRSRHAVLLPLVLVPGYALAGFTGAVLTMILMTAALCWLTAAVCHDLQRPTQSVARPAPPAAGATVLAWALLTLTAPLALYSHQIWVEVPGALLLLLGYRQLRTITTASRRTSNVAALRHHRRELVLLLAVFLLLPILKIRFGLLAAALGAVFVLRSRLPKRQLALVGGASLAALAAVLIYNHFVYGNALRIHSWSELTASHFSLQPMMLRLAGLLFDPAFGLLASAPLWALVIPGAWLLARRDPHTALDLALVSAPYVLVVASRSEWYGGWSPPFRYAAVLLPFLTILAAEAYRQRQSWGARFLLAPLLVLSAAAGALWTAIPGWTYNFANGSAFWVDRWTQLSGVDWMRWLPSATRPNMASWAVPAGATMVILFIWLLPKSRTSGRVASMLGIAATIGAVATVTAAARLEPTKHVEAESIMVTKTGGHPEPRQWTLDRTLYREGWTLRHMEQIRVPVRAGGDTVKLTLALRLFRNRNEDLDLHVFADQRRIGGFLLKNGDVWSQQTIGPVDWHDASELVISAGPPRSDAEPNIVNGAAIDFVRFEWQ